MAGTFTAKLLAEGQLATSWAAIYTVPASTAAYIKDIWVFNTNAAAQTIEIRINGSGTGRKRTRLTLNINESADILEGNGFTLEAGDSIEAQTTTATAVDYTVHGVQET